MTREQKDAALALWPGLARRAGLDPGGWSARVISARSDVVARRIVIAMTRGAVVLVLKHAPWPVDAEAFASGVESLRAAAVRLGDGPVRVPKVLAVDEGAQALVMEFVAGQTVFDALGVGDADAVMRRAGEALGAFHRAGVVGRRVFQPRYGVRFLREVLDDLATGRRQVADAEAFARHARALIGQAGAFAGRETVAAHLHGDLHLRNMILGEGSAALIDLKPTRPGPVGHDIARMIVDAASMFPQEVPMRTGVAAFLVGYGLVGTDDPGVGMQCRMRILADWMTIPVDPRERTANQARRYLGVRRLAESVLPE